MIAVIDRADVDRFSALIVGHLGLYHEPDRVDFLFTVLRRRLEATESSSFEQYAARLATKERAGELRALAEQLTIGETFFFRNPDNFRALAERVIPERLTARHGERRLNILSAGCASGEEPYSLAITLRETLPDLARWDATILAADVNRTALEKASKGRYSSWSLRSTIPDIQQRYFRDNGREAVLRDSTREMVSFEEHNLADERDPLWQSARFDVVFCRNVIMYFTPDVRRAVVHRFHRILMPGGFLFLGHAETLRGVSHGFSLQHTHDTFYYQRLPSSDGVSPSSDAWPAIDRAADIAPDIDATGSSWVDVIKNASERIASLASDPRPNDRPQVVSFPRTTAHSAPVATVGHVLDAMRHERFSDALDLLTTLPSAVADAPDTLLLQAALLANAGRLDDAERACRRLLALDELSAGAHYLMALCREHADDAAGALDHDQTAIYLDASFAMPHLHLGLLARRSGDATTARAELEQALVLLDGEDSSRLLLFGGGFSRETLLQLCRGELGRVEVPA